MLLSPKFLDTILNLKFGSAPGNPFLRSQAGPLPTPPPGLRPPSQAATRHWLDSSSISR